MTEIPATATTPVYEHASQPATSSLPNEPRPDPSTQNDDLPLSETSSLASPPPPPPPTPPPPPASTQRKRKRGSSKEDEETAALARAISLIDRQPEEDQFSAYGTTLASRMRTLSPEVQDSCMTYISMAVTCFKKYPHINPTFEEMVCSLNHIWHPPTPTPLAPAAAFNKPLPSAPSAAAGAPTSRVVAQSEEHHPDWSYYSYSQSLYEDQ
ncbi:uncharacterized protein LOC143774007 [Ranitomeya variabilis]|uniref:uncharacterized protein LOC143774007 n=1 Tax=Ranitomeya variabilis TaxID=490064 RepID=UPI004056AFA1